MKAPLPKLLTFLSLHLPLCLVQQTAHAQSQAIDVATGYSHSCAVLTSGSLKCWGNNGFGQLGDGTYTSRTSAVQVKGLENETVTQVSAGNTFTCALTASAKVYCWGDNRRGQLGAGSTLERSIKPLPVLLQTGGAKAISVGMSHACLIDSYGNVYCWGDDGSGQLNRRGGANKYSNYPLFIVGESDFVSISSNQNHTCGVINSGAVKCFGGNSSAQLGFGDTTTRFGTPLAIPGLNGVMQVSSGTFGSCAVNKVNEVYCWGANFANTLGYPGTTPYYSVPLRITSVRPDILYTKSGFGHHCALTAGGKVQCWGSNAQGQLGRGTPADITHVAGDVLPLPEFVSALAAGSYHNCAIVSGGGVKCWGKNDYGQIGNGTKANAPSAVPVIDL